MKVVCIGAGKLANQLMPALQSAGCEIMQIYNRTAEPAKILSDKLDAIPYTTIIAQMVNDADAYFFTIADDAVPLIADQVNSLVTKNALGVHCSGSLSLDVLPFLNKAGFYPLQSFSEHHDVSWKFIPIIITTDDESIWMTLDEIASKMSSAVYRMTDYQKSLLHVAAVFANNFSNHMLALAETICKTNNLPFEILKPLIMETFSKAIISGPSSSQTGPAIRGDAKTIEKHMQLLSNYPELGEVYRVVTESIIKGHRNTDE